MPDALAIYEKKKAQKAGSSNAKQNSATKKSKDVVNLDDSDETESKITGKPDDTDTSSNKPTKSSPKKAAANKASASPSKSASTKTGTPATSPSAASKQKKLSDFFSK